MNVLLRLIGVPVLQALIARLPRPVARALGAVLVVCSSLLPFGALATRQITLGDVVLVYWIESVLIFGWSIIRARTSRAGTDETRRFAPLFGSVFFGIWSLVMGVWAIIIAVSIGLTGGVVQYVVIVGAILLSTSYSLAYQWFFRGQRDVVSPIMAVVPAIPRCLPLMAGTLVGAFTSTLLTDEQVRAGLLLIAFRTVVDIVVQLALDLIGERRLANDVPTAAGRRATAEAG
ncbi:MAG: DUF6498-containing protein [Intrasporangium sp.]|uniref:DUF6498-containing protein n=1 Tax=Intrasporangium sp. TaxID=1925024 RepID=UPI003F7F8A24